MEIIDFYCRASHIQLTNGQQKYQDAQYVKQAFEWSSICI